MLKVYSETKRSASGLLCSVRYMLTEEEFEFLQTQGLLGDAEEVFWMQHASDALCAQWERESLGAQLQ